jgi:hypothetical protein
MRNDVRAHALNRCCRATSDRLRLALACSSIRFEIARADPVMQLLHFCSDPRRLKPLTAQSQHFRFVKLSSEYAADVETMSAAPCLPHQHARCNMTSMLGFITVRSILRNSSCLP